MGKVILYTAVSLDGFVAGEKDDLSWLFEADTGGEDNGKDYNDFYSGIETVIMGNGTYRWVIKEGIENPYPEKNSYVFTRAEGLESSYVTYVSEDPAEFTRKLLERESGNIWLVGGGVINGLLLKADLIDELQLTIVPVSVGKGARLFEGDNDLRKFIISSSQMMDNGFLKVIYRRV